MTVTRAAGHPATRRRAPCARASRSSPAPVNGHRSSTSTTPPPRRSRDTVIAALVRLLRRTPTPTSTAASTPSPRRRPRPTRRAAARVARFVNAPDRARAWSSSATPPRRSTWSRTRGGAKLAAGDEVLLTEMEHHSNLVPWHMLARERGVVLRHVPIDDDGELDLAAFARLLDDRARRSSRSPRCRTCSARSTRSPRSPPRRIASARWSLVDGAQSRAAHAGRLPRRSASTSWPSPATRRTARPGVGFLVGTLDAARPAWSPSSAAAR